MLSFNKPVFWRSKSDLLLRLKGPWKPALKSKVQPELSERLRLNNSALGNCTQVKILHVYVVVLLGPESKVTSLWMGLGLPESRAQSANLMRRCRMWGGSEDAEGCPWSGWEQNLFFLLSWTLRTSGLVTGMCTRTLMVESASMVFWPVKIAWKLVKETPGEKFHRVGLGL